MKWNIIGHEKQLRFLEDKMALRETGALDGFKLGHALLFVGPENIGKFTIGKTLAKILQCSSNFCHTCPTCVQISKGYHLDTIEMDDDGESIKIERIREVIGRLNMTSQSAYKIFLLANIGRLTEEAANSLLKILEEPPEKTVFVFTATTLREVLPTILSRMQIIKLKAVEEKILREALTEQYRDLSADMLEQVVMLSLGRPGKAISLIQDPEKFAFYQDLFTQVRSFQQEQSAAKKFQLVQKIVDAEKKEKEENENESSRYVKEFLTLLLVYVRQQLITARSAQEKAGFLKVLENIHEVFNLLKRNVNTRLLLENFSL